MTVCSFVCFSKEAELKSRSLQVSLTFFYTCSYSSLLPRKNLCVAHIHYWRGMMDPDVSFWFGSAWAVHLSVYLCSAVGNARFRLHSSSISHWRIGEKSCAKHCSGNGEGSARRNQFPALQSPSTVSHFAGVLRFIKQTPLMELLF